MLEQLRVDRHAPWKQRFRLPQAISTQIAQAAPTRGLAASNLSGVYQLYAWDVPTGDLRPLTNRPEGQLFGTFSPDGRFVYYLNDRMGNEIGHFVRLSFEGGAPEDITPSLPDYSPAGLAVSHDGALIGLISTDPAGFHFYTIAQAADGALGAPRLAYQRERPFFGPTLSYDGTIAVLTSTERSGKMQFSALALDTSSGAPIGELWDGPDTSVEPGAFARLPDDTRILATTNRSGVKRPLVWDARTGDRRDLAIDELEGEVVPVDWAPDGQRVLLCQFANAVQRLYFYDLRDDTLTRLEHPAGSFDEIYFVPSGAIFAQWQDSTHPPRLIELDGETGEQTRTVLLVAEAPPSQAWRSISFTSPDGQAIQGWLGLPEGHGPFPTILETHGGPTWVTTEQFSSGAQAWLDHGFAFLSINYHGSTTFGKAFEECIWGDLGHWEVEDMAAARDWLIAQGIARSDQILLTGWSYGGYLTLQALGKKPELWAGGMAGIAIADWAIQYEDSADMLRNYQRMLFGGTPEEQPEQYAASSPISYAERVSAPVLIIQGRNDTRTPARPIELYESKMRALGKPITVHWFDTGHLGSFAQVELAIEHQEIMLKFAYEVLGRGKDSA
jgi:dipeptidyl aminopeptidase/acylaminoacyl peptidase